MAAPARDDPLPTTVQNVTIDEPPKPNTRRGFC